MNTPIGRILLPATGTNVTGFVALIAVEHIPTVSVGVAVVADTADGDVVGIITDLSTIGTDTDPVLAGNINRAEANALVNETREALVATVQTFHSPALRPVRGGTIRHANAEDLNIMTDATNIDVPIPVGSVKLADGGYAPIFVDADELLGPLAAHLIVGGRSGAAAKTSYISVLLATTMTVLAKSTRRGAALLFNVKGPDLLTLDRPAPAGELDSNDVALYESLGVQPTAFTDVTVYAPGLPGGVGTRSAREDAVAFQWELKDIRGYLQYLDSRFYDNDSSQSLVDDLWVNKVENPKGGVNTLNDMIGFLEQELADAEEAGRADIWHSHHSATARKMLRTFRALTTNTNGLVTGGRAGRGLDIPTEFRDGQVVVVDVADLDPKVQAAVIARTCSKLLYQVNHGGLGVDNLIVFADELNVFAPSTGGEVPRHVRDTLGKVAATGRYAGITLWGAAQFPSQIHGQIRDNASTIAVGAIAEAELDSGVYGRLPAGVREQMVTAKRGTMLVRAANLRSWTPVMFPRPAWSTGAKTTVGRVRTNLDAVALSDQTLANLSEGVDQDHVDRIVASVEADPAKVAAELEKVRDPDMRRISPEPSSSYDPKNPWSLLDD